jgi:hypothetical protein
MEDALIVDGSVLHVTITVDSYQASGIDAALDFDELRDEMWLDGKEKRARIEKRWPASEGAMEQREIVVGDGLYRAVTDERPTRLRALTCRGSTSPILAPLMGCTNYLEESTTTVEAGEYDGAHVLVLATHGDLPSHDWTATFSHRLYLEPETFLPLGDEIDQSIPADGEEMRVMIERKYDVEEVPRESLPANYFEPSSIGYAESDPAANLESQVVGMRVYWLGKDYVAPLGLPDLTLHSASSRTSAGSPGYRATLAYRRADDEFGAPLISLQEYPLDAWDALQPDTGGHIWNTLGVSREDVILPSGRAVIFRVPSTYERYLAHVYLGSTVILVGDYDEATPYASRDAFLALVGALTPVE